MTRVRSVKTSFTGGEIAPGLLGRGDLSAYETGAARLRNVIIQPTGGVRRRPGLAHLAAAPGPGRLAAFTFNSRQSDLLLFTDRRLTVFREEEAVAVLDTPWTAAHLPDLAWAQSADVLLLVHPEVAPRRLLREGGEGTYRLDAWAWTMEGGVPRQPLFRFAPADVTITPSGTSGRIRLTASAPVFDPALDGLPFRLYRRALRIAAIRSPTLAEADVLETLPGVEATADWAEPAFSPRRGWPVSVCFHQDRLVIGGSRDLPNRLWFSRSGDLFNFDLGTGEDDAAIEFAILSDEVNPIRHVVSGRHLQVFTTGAEWAVTGEPLTPGAIRLDRQTRIGAVADRQIPLREVEGATLFAAADGGIREFAYTEAERAYQAGDLALAARHLTGVPVDLEHDRLRRLLLLVRADGTAAALTLYRTEQVTAWTVLETAGLFLSVTSVAGRIYWLVDRDGRVAVEAWDDAFHLDAALAGTTTPPTPRWSGLDHLKGREVGVLADGRVLPDRAVAAGRITLDRPAATVQAGLRFTHEVAPLPVNPLAAEGSGRRMRPLAVTFRLEGTPVLRVDLGHGPREVALRRAAGAVLAEGPAPAFTGDRRLTCLGWSRDAMAPLWRIIDDRPLPFTCLSATLEMKVND
ncbi:MAG: hypothetical protein RLY86_3037 [Pseudomonadota bacterium]|jgi:hypothetical protein